MALIKLMGVKPGRHEIGQKVIGEGLYTKGTDNSEDYCKDTCEVEAED